MDVCVYLILPELADMTQFIQKIQRLHKISTHLSHGLETHNRIQVGCTQLFEGRQSN